MEHESAKWRQDDAPDDAPVQQPMRQSAKPIQRRRPDAEQKKVRREMQRRTAGYVDEYRDQFERSSPAKDWDMSEGRTMAPSPDSVSAQMSDSSVAGGAGSDGGSAPSSSTSGSGGSSSTAGFFHDKPVLLAGYGHVCERHGQGPHSPDAFRVESHHRRFPIILCTSHALGEGYDVPTKSDYERTASIDRAGDRECQACGHTGAPVLADTGPACRQCGSYSLKRSDVSVKRDPAPAPMPAKSDYQRSAALADPGRLLVTSTQLETNVASSDGRILLNKGDNIRLPNGQTTQVRNVRKHETSGDHYYVDTDTGTTVVPWSTSFQVVPSDTRQQSLPGLGTPGGNFNYLPGNTQNPGTSNQAPSGNTCPVCGTSGSLARRGDKYTCTRCGYSENFQGGGTQYSDSPQMLTPPRQSSLNPRSVVARRAAEVYSSHEGDPL